MTMEKTKITYSTPGLSVLEVLVEEGIAQSAPSADHFSNEQGAAGAAWSEEDNMYL